MVMTLDDLEELAENCGGGGLKGWIERRQKVLDGLLQRVWVLKAQGSKICLSCNKTHPPLYVWPGALVGSGRHGLLVI